MPAARKGVQVIARALEILHALEGERDGLSLARIAARVGLPRSTVQRIVDALAVGNLVIAASPAGRVRLGPALLRFAASARLEAAQLLRPSLEWLSQTTEETVDLSVLSHGNAVFLDQIVGAHRLRAVSAIGASFPLHCSANGKAMLALMTPEELARFRRAPLPRLTPNTITTWPRLEAEIRKVRAKGFAEDNEEHAVGICAVGVAFRGHDGELFAISIPTPTHRFRNAEGKLVTALLECRRRIIPEVARHQPETAAPARLGNRHGRARAMA
jgi:DNA-binding IclR family transcriptional regulator